MVTFRTPVAIPVFSWKTGYREKQLFIGSCFTENIGERMAELKFDTDINPCGILYNPVSAGNCLRMLLEKKQLSAGDLFQRGGMWHSFSHHSRFSAETAEKALTQMNGRLEQSSRFLEQAGFLFLTFGTAWIYEWKATGQVVANCHKLPASGFRRFRLSVAEITGLYRDLLTDLWAVNPGLKVVFTVSPVRHWSDGATENQLSKATLLLAIDALLRGFGTERCAYFPSYEMVMDELRDYRFYAEDMLHLSPVAVQYIWEAFSAALIGDESHEVLREVQNILRAVAHRPFNKKSDEYLKFCLNSLQTVSRLADRFPGIDLSVEKDYFQRQIDEFGNRQEQMTVEAS